MQRLLILLLSINGWTAVGQVAWHFEFDGGPAGKLVWQTRPGQTCDLRESVDLSSWRPAPGFPKVATSESMEHTFAPGDRGFYQISVAEAAGGWQLAALPALPTDSTWDLASICALDPLRLWVAGAVSPGSDVCVLRSEDGGAHWSLSYRAAGIGFFGEIKMATAQVGYAAGGGIRRTTDGGATWEIDQGNQPDPPGNWHSVGPDGYVYGMAVVDAEQVWTAGYDGASAGVLYHRIPGRPQPDPAHPNANTPWWLEWAQERTALYGISAVDSTRAWAVGWAGNIWVTTDGEHWAPQTAPTTQPLQDVVAVDAQTAWAVGDGGTILKTTDGGANWKSQNSGTTENLRRIAAVNASVAWAVGGAGVILHTTDGGTTWIRQSSGTTAALQGVTATDAQTAWVVGLGNTLLRTTDGGEGSWAAPTIASVTPNVVGSYAWPSASVTVKGSGFRGGTLRASFGSTPAETVTWIDASTVQIVVPSGLVGTLDLVVRNEDGQQAMLPRAVTFVLPPVITRYSPWHDSASGGYQITIDGLGLQSVSRGELYLEDGTAEALPTTVVDSTRVVLTVPVSTSRPAGRASLVLSTAENQFASTGDFRLDPPGGPAFAVTSISSTVGTPLTTVSVTGVGFSSSATLELCGWNVVVEQRSATSLTGRVAGNPGLGQLVVMNDDENGINIEPAFLLLAGPVPGISQISPPSGPSAGGTSVTITGSDFMLTDTVFFDGYLAEVTGRSSSHLVVTVPPHAPGPANVVIQSEDLERGYVILPAGFIYE